MLLSLALILTSALCTTAQTNRTYPQNVEIDLIFPRNESYPPLYPFPVIFALQNPAAIWPFGFSFRYIMEVWHEAENRTKMMLDGFEDFGHWPERPEEQVYPDDGHNPLLVINSTRMIAGMENTWGVVRWTIGFTYNCSANASGIDNVDRIPYLSGHTHFHIDRDAPVPDLNDTTKCPQRVGAYRIKDKIDPRGSNIWTCPVLSERPDPGDSCWATVPENLASRVADEMTEFIGCPKASWPNPTATTCAEMGAASTVGRFGGLIGMVGVACLCAFFSLV